MLTATKPILPADETHFQSYFEALISEYRDVDNRANRNAARVALRRALAESDDPGQTRCLLFEAAHRHLPLPGSGTLAEFIEAGSWRAENLPFNRTQAGGSGNRKRSETALRCV
jgi:hypothetical protein